MKTTFRALLAASLCLLTGCNVSTNGGDVYLSDFLDSASAESDAVPAIRAAVAYCAKTGASRLVLPGGELRLRPDRAEEKYQFISNNGYGESSTDLVFGGNGLIVESGRMLRRTERFSTEEQLIVADIDTEKLLNSRRRTTTFAPHRPAERIIVEIPLPENPANVTLDREFSSHPFVPQTPEEMDESGREIINIQTMGLAQRLQHTDCKKVVIGVSGGLDSTLALLIAVRTFDRLGLDRKGIIGVTMPGFGTSNRTYRNSIALMRCLGITSREISIRKACEQHFADIGLNPEEQSSAYENAQARERTQILMDIANMEHGMVLGTGDLSELALGWATYNGDQMSMYGLNASLPKTLIQVLLRWMAQVCQDDAIREILLDVVATPISPELLPSGEEGGIAQHTEKLVGPYELHDFFLYHFIQNGYSPAKIGIHRRNLLLARLVHLLGQNPKY